MESPTPEENAPRCKHMPQNYPSLLQKAISNTQREVSRKEDILRQLNIVKSHRKKNQEEPITELIEQWRSAAQQAILDFQRHMAEPRLGLKDILANFQIEASVIGYSEDDYCFV